MTIKRNIVNVFLACLASFAAFTTDAFSGPKSESELQALFDRSTDFLQEVEELLRDGNEDGADTLDDFAGEDRPTLPYVYDRQLNDLSEAIEADIAAVGSEKRLLEIRDGIERIRGLEAANILFNEKKNAKSDGEKVDQWLRGERTDKDKFEDKMFALTTFYKFYLIGQECVKANVALSNDDLQAFSVKLKTPEGQLDLAKSDRDAAWANAEKEFNIMRSVLTEQMCRALRIQIIATFPGVLDKPTSENPF